MIPEQPSALDRLWRAFGALVRAELPVLSFLGVYEYRVTATDGTGSTAATTVDCEPTDPKISLPPLEKVPIRLPYGVTPPEGALCSVQFLNGDPSKPMVTNFSDPMTLLVFAGGTLPNARQGDMVAVTLGGTPGSIGQANMAILAAQLANGGGPLTYTPAAGVVFYGIVSSGRPTVKS